MGSLVCIHGFEIHNMPNYMIFIRYSVSTKHISTSISSYDLSSCLKTAAEKNNQNNPEWSVTFEQFLASIMNESCLVDYFDHHVDVVSKLKMFGDTKLNRHESVSTSGSKSVFYA